MNYPGYTDPVYVVEQLRQAQLYSWRICLPATNSNKTDTIIFNGPENGPSASESNLTHLTSHLGNLAPGRYIIMADKPCKEEGRQQFTNSAIRLPFIIQGPASTNAQIASPGQPGGAGLYTEMQLQQMMALERERMNKEFEIKEIRRELEEIRNSPPSGAMDRFFEAVTPYIGQIIPGVAERMGIVPTGTARVGLTGFKEQQQTLAPTTEEEAQQIVEDAIQRWADVEEELPSILAALADMAHNQPERYAMAKKLLFT